MHLDLPVCTYNTPLLQIRRKNSKKNLLGSNGLRISPLNNQNIDLFSWYIICIVDYLQKQLPPRHFASRLARFRSYCKQNLYAMYKSCWKMCKTVNFESKSRSSKDPNQFLISRSGITIRLWLYSTIESFEGS
jgi:hypothetical protein